MRAYYNEIDPFAAEWLRQLVAAGHIAPGIVDERSIEDVKPDELKEFTQCHFFAGIGAWSYALRQAGWPDDKPVWTGSCPCQPFSAAGKGAGFDDERHLWPAWYHLISQCKPASIFGEQVSSKIVEPWIDLVQSDMEAMGYAFGCVAFPSAGVGAPHLRDRAYWVGHSANKGLEGRGRPLRGEQWTNGQVNSCCSPGRLANANGTGQQSGSERPTTTRYGNTAESDVCLIGVANTNPEQQQKSLFGGEETAGREQDSIINTGLCSNNHSAPTNGYWVDVDWLGCRDGKWRPVEPGTFPLAHGITNRVGKLRGYGNAINAEAAKEFIKAFIDLPIKTPGRD